MYIICNRRWLYELHSERQNVAQQQASIASLTSQLHEAKGEASRQQEALVQQLETQVRIQIYINNIYIYIIYASYICQHGDIFSD